MSDNEIIVCLRSVRKDAEKLQSTIDKLLSTVYQDVKDQDIILQVILNYFSISKESFLAYDKHREKVIPRYFYVLFTKSLLGLSLARIGVNIGNKDHATSLHGINTIINLLQTKDEGTIETYNHLVSILESNGFDVKKISLFIAERELKKRSSLRNLRHA